MLAKAVLQVAGTGSAMDWSEERLELKTSPVQRSCLVV